MRHREPRPDSEIEAMFAAVESLGIKFYKPGPDRTTLTFANFTFDEQEQVEKYTQRLIDEAYALCIRLQEQCPILVNGEVNQGDLDQAEQVYRAQYHAMMHLNRRIDDREWIHVNIMKGRRWMQGAQLESMN